MPEKTSNPKEIKVLFPGLLVVLGERLLEGKNLALSRLYNLATGVPWIFFLPDKNKL